jgi:Domain of unknown function (DUF4397)
LLTASCKEARETGAVSSKGDGRTSTAPPSESAEDRDMALVRVINASPADPVVDVWAGDSAAFKGVGYKKSTAYREIPANRFDFQIKRAPDARPLAQNRENLHDGGYYTIVALPDHSGADKRNLRVLNDELEPVSPEKARIRFINGVPGDNDVDLYIDGRDAPLFDGVNFKSEAGWNEVDPMAGTLIVRPDNSRTVLATLPEVKLEGGRSYTFVFAGAEKTERTEKADLIRVEDDVAGS